MTTPVLRSSRLGWARSRLLVDRRGYGAPVRVHIAGNRAPVSCSECGAPIVPGELFIWRSAHWRAVCRVCHPFTLPPALERKLPQ